MNVKNILVRNSSCELANAIGSADDRPAYNMQVAGDAQRVSREGLCQTGV